MGHPTMQENDTAKLTPTHNDINGYIYVTNAEQNVLFMC